MTITTRRPRDSAAHARQLALLIHHTREAQYALSELLILGQDRAFIEGSTLHPHDRVHEQAWADLRGLHWMYRHVASIIEGLGSDHVEVIARELAGQEGGER